MKNTPRYGWSHPEPGDHTRTWEYWDTFEAVDASLHAEVESINTDVDDVNDKLGGGLNLATARLLPGTLGGSGQFEILLNLVVGQPIADLSASRIRILKAGAYQLSYEMAVNGVTAGATIMNALRVHGGAYLAHAHHGAGGSSQQAFGAQAPLYNLDPGVVLTCELWVQPGDVGDIVSGHVNLIRLRDQVPGLPTVNAPWGSADHIHPTQPDVHQH